MNLKSMGARFTGLVAVVGVAVGCGSSEGPGGDPGPNPTISISVTPASLTVVQGGSGSVAASITRGGGFTGTVNIVTEGAPAGVTAAVSNVTTSGTTTSGTVTVTVPTSVAPGTYTLTVRASGSGVTDATATFSLTVTALPAIALTVAPTAVSVIAGASGAATVTIARTNFTGDVTLALEGGPAGVTGTFNPAAANGTTSALTVQVAGSVVAGTYPLTIRGTGTGISAATTALSLTVTAPVPSFDISPVVPDPKQLTQGTAGDVTVTLTRSNGFAGTVNLTLEDAPTGVTGVFAPSAVAGTTSTLTLTVGATVPAGNYTLKVRGAATGQTDKTRTFVLAVAAVPASYTLTTTPAGPVAVQQNGATVNVTININRTNFPGSVAVAVTANSGGAGLTAVLNPTSSTGNSVNLALSATTGVAVGSYSVTVTGTATGLSNQTATLGVNVTAASGGSGNVTIDFSGCSVDQRAVWLAYQDGTGPWTVAVPTGNVYQFNILSGKGGVAWVQDPTGPGSAVLVAYFSQAEMTGFGATQFCSTPTATKTVTAQTANLGANRTAFVSLGGGTGLANFAQTLATLNGVTNGTHDLVAYARDIMTPGLTDRVFIKRDVNTTAIAPGGSVGFPVDFTDGTDSFAPAQATFTIGGTTGGDQVGLSAFYRTGADCRSGLLYSVAPAAVAAFEALGIPANKQRPTDSHGALVSATAGSSTRTQLEYFAAFGNRLITLPQAIPVFTPTSVAGSYKALRFQFALPAALASSASLSYSEVLAAKSAIITATNAWLGGTAVDVTMPNFSGLAGWSDAWMPASGAAVEWTASGAGSTLTGPCAAGSVSSASRTGSL